MRIRWEKNAHTHININCFVLFWDYWHKSYAQMVIRMLFSKTKIESWHNSFIPYTDAQSSIYVMLVCAMFSFVYVYVCLIFLHFASIQSFGCLEFEIRTFTIHWPNFSSWNEWKKKLFSVHLFVLRVRASETNRIWILVVEWASCILHLI